jgi:predicted phosphodiesterase
MRVAVLSDIHGNRHAFEAVLDDVATAGADELWCLGDVVGYGAEPDACVELVRDRCAICLAGNHDMAATGEISTEEFSRGAAISAQWTQKTLRPENLEFLRRLRPEGVEGELGLYHASPRDPVWEYVLSTILADECLDAAPQRLSLIGHSHVALAFTRPDGGDTRGFSRADGDEADLGSGGWLLNPGSVGQPRDGDPRAAWLELDTSAWTATWRRVEYDVAGAQSAIRAAGLPDSLAERLGYGQ